MSADVESEVSAVLSKDMENIAAKVAAGKTLTSSEREFFMRQQPEVKDDNRITTKTMLADEPTGNLDSKNGEAVMELLTSLHAEGSTIVMVTHNPEFFDYTQRVVHVIDGKIVSEDRHSM
ncbi:MAG: hypothetical protein QGH41_06120 [Roseibacillus sp.]|nr:hypothetical protein [Roseibacillus sp.]